MVDRIFILGFASSSVYDETTASMLAEHGDFVFRNKLSKKDDKYTKDDVLIRYGNVTYPKYDKYFGVVMNKVNSIKLNCDKLRAYQMLMDAGISLPEMWTNSRLIQYPALRRKKKHSRANDIVIMTSADKFVRGDFYTKFIESSREYRVHIFDGKCIRLSLKVPSSEGTESDLIKSSSTGWTLSDHYNHIIDVEREIIAVSKRALEVLGLDFGCCDILVEKNTNKVYLLEVNTSPRLARYGRECYTKAIIDKFDLEQDEEEVKLGMIFTWEYRDTIPIEYRRAYKQKQQRLDNTLGLR